MSLSSVCLLLLVACAAAIRVSPASLHRPAVARSRVNAFAMQAPTAEDEEEEFEFGDAGGVSAATDAAIEEEVELTEQQKENARLRAAEKFMMRDTGNARCCNRHDGRRHMRIAPPRHITSSGFDRNQLLACPQPRRQFSLKLLNRLFLCLGKGYHPVAGKADIVLELL